MSEYFHRLIHITILNFKFLIDYWFIHFVLIIIVTVVELYILANNKE